MSPKRFRRHKLRKTMKQIKAIKTRLMEINYKLDRYVYKNEKVISVVDAVKYIEEMADYKIQCNGDERSLQVIEKISCCMKSIIYEEQEGINATNQTLAEDINCPSPVYSVCDNNDLALTQSPKGKGPDKETTTLDSSNEVTANNWKEIQVEVEIHRAMSNLTVADVPETQCSQSILDDFDVNNAQKLNNANLSTDKLDIHIAKDKPKDDAINKYIAFKRTLSNAATNVFENNNKTTEVAKPENAKQYVTEISKTTKKTEKKDTNNTLVKTARNSVKLNIKYDISNSNKHKQIKKKPPESKNGQNITKRKRSNTKTKSINLKLDQSVKKINSENKTNVADNVTNNPNTAIANPKTNNKKRFKTVKTPLIYNALVENDLSWIENIRSVREINNEEYEPFTANVDFWDNYTFPANWNEDDWNF